MMNESESANTKKSSVVRPYNSYNLFFTLERVRFVEEKKKEYLVGSDRNTDIASFNGYAYLDLPPLPPRYEHLESILPHNWYVPGKNKQSKRKHLKTHGVASFKEIATMVAKNWKAVDPVTKSYVEDVAKIQRNRYAELMEVELLNALAMKNSSAESAPSKNNESPVQVQDDRPQVLFDNMPGNHYQPWHQEVSRARVVQDARQQVLNNMPNNVHQPWQHQEGQRRKLYASNLMTTMPTKAVSHHRLDNIVSNCIGNPMRGIFDEVDVSDEAILNIYNSMD